MSQNVKGKHRQLCLRFNLYPSLSVEFHPLLTPSSQSEWVRGGGCCGGEQGWAWLGGLSLPEAAYTGGGRQWPQKPGGCGQTETQGQLPLSRSVLSLVNSKTHFSLSHVSSSRLSHSFNFFSLIDPANDIFTEKAWCPAKSEPLTPLRGRW